MKIRDFFYRVIWSLSLLLPCTSWGEVSLRLTESLTIDQRLNNQNLLNDDDDYGILINRLNLNGTVYQFDVNARFDTVLLHEAPSTLYRNDPFRVERLSVQRRIGSWSLTVGDLYQQLGRGQLLALRKVDELGLDIALRGAKLEWSSGDHQLLGLGGISNVVNLDTVSQRFVEDRADVIAGSQYAYQGFEWGEMGLMYVFLAPEEQTLSGLALNDATSAGGLYLDVPALTDDLGAYVEVDFQQRRVLEKLSEGHAAYLAINQYLGDSHILVEGLYLDDFQQRGSENTVLRRRFDYMQGPTLERIDQEVTEFYDVRGARVRVQHEFLDGDLSIHGNGLLRHNRPGDSLELMQYHGFAGVEYRFDQGRSRWSASGGHRIDEQAEKTTRTWSHGEGDLVYYLGQRYALHLSNQTQRIQIEEQPAFLRGSTIFTVERAGLGSLGFEWGVDSQKRALTGDLAELFGFSELDGSTARNGFFAGLISWDLSRQLLLRGVFGHQRGGIKCIGGVCRDFPPFSGVRVQAIYRHELF